MIRKLPHTLRCIAHLRPNLRRPQLRTQLARRAPTSVAAPARGVAPAALARISRAIHELDQLPLEGARTAASAALGGGVADAAHPAGRLRGAAMTVPHYSVGCRVAVTSSAPRSPRCRYRRIWPLRTPS